MIARLGVRLGATLALLVAASATWLAAAPHRDEQRFPHAKHAKLFPSCLGCHVGVVRDSLGQFPTPQQCTVCHDGRALRAVSWNGPAARGTNLQFSHLKHNAVAKLGDPLFNCRQCHAQLDSREFMAVQRAVPALCISCHTHAASSHLAEEAVCRTCHVPLVQAASLTDSAISRFPKPPSHERPGFISAHGVSVDEVQSRCAICHARESCARCHLEPARVPAIAALGSDPRVLRLASSRAPWYPTPQDHQLADWAYTHGGVAKAHPEKCSNCHAQSSCLACHTGRMAEPVIRQLPNERPGGPRGVRLLPQNPAWPAASSGAPVPGYSKPNVNADTARDVQPPVAVRVHWAGFTTSHSASASTRDATCAGCHDKRFCSNCHDGEAANQRRFHPANFAQRHATDSYSRQRDCATCHNPEVFCRSCHINLGLQSDGRFNVAFHTRQPDWLLQHGRAARQGLESCTSCHQQRDCMRCHSQLGWGVSPHGPGFDAARMQKRNPSTCRYCHVGDPLAKP